MPVDVPGADEIGAIESRRCVRIADLREIFRGRVKMAFDRIELAAGEIRFGGTGAMEPQRDVRLPAPELAHGGGGDPVDPDTWGQQPQRAAAWRRRNAA